MATQNHKVVTRDEWMMLLDLIRAGNKGVGMRRRDAFFFYFLFLPFSPNNRLHEETSSSNPARPSAITIKDVHERLHPSTYTIRRIHLTTIGYTCNLYTTVRPALFGHIYFSVFTFLM